MAKDTNLDVSFIEKVGDAFNGFQEGVVSFLGRLFGSSNERAIRALGYTRGRHAEDHIIAPGSLLDQVNQLEEQMQQLGDDELKALTPQWKERLGQGETLDDLLPEVFAACREVAYRTKNMRHFDVQILGGIVLHRGNIAEMVTGEGKTLVATLPACLNALEERGVHIVTVNDYLARRDCEWMSPIYNGLGFSCGYIQSDMDPVARRKAYDCDITYGTNSEFGFDYLRDNMKPARWGDPSYPSDMHQCQKALHYAIIDEVDNILIDEARTPLIISGPAFDDPRKYSRANDIVLKLNELQKQNPGKYFEVKEKEHTVHLTDDGVRKAEELAGVESFYTAGNMEWPHLLDNALKAHHLYHKDKQYVVMRHPEENVMAIIIVDEFTGRLMVGRQWSDGLHQAVEAKHAREGVKIKEETQTLATITLQNYFKLYDKLAGMTGTAMTEANEFWKIYKLDVIAIPTNMPLIRDDRPDMIYLTEQEKWNAVAEEIEKINKWDIIELTDGTELLGTVKKEATWEVLTLADGTELIGKTKDWCLVKMKDGGEIEGILQKEGDEELTVKFDDTGERRVIPLDDVEDYEITKVEVTLHGSKKKRDIDPDDIEDESETREIEFVERGSNEKHMLSEDDIESWEPRGRPILIGTTNVDKSEKLSAMLKRRGIHHELLNAKPEYAAREADIVAQAGRIGAVTISTNMAGRGTDIILGGNLEALAWARLKDKFESRLEVPDEEWRRIMDDIEAKEHLKSEGRKVAQMGGLHVIGTERHEARRIDNQLRGRSGRQGDPGSTRFYLSLQDDLMRVFAGEWAAKVLSSLGMEEGQAIESRMVSRRIAAAQKKVEERNFDTRRHLLEYDEVMDHQRKSIYGYRQKILEGANCKLLVCEMLREQIDGAIEEFMDLDYGAACFAEFASNRLSVEFRQHDFRRMDFPSAENYAKNRAERDVRTQVHDILEENLNPDADVSEWNWQACSQAINARWGIKLNERQLKKIGRDDLAEQLIEEATEAVEKIDLSDGRKFLDENWGVQSVCDWVRLKFQIAVEPDELAGKETPEIQQLVYDNVCRLYQDKDVEFPVKLGIARFMSERTVVATGGEKIADRDGLKKYCEERFPNVGDIISDGDFKSLQRTKMLEKLLEVSRATFPKLDQFQLDANLKEAFGDEDYVGEDTAGEFAEWLKEETGLEIDAEELADSDFEEARHLVWNAYDEKHRPEMRKMERGLLLTHLDNSWKNHLHVMDHLRQGVGLSGYAQEDPKTVYKQEGMKEFDGMWQGIRDKVSETIFRMEEGSAFEESVWDIRDYQHEEATFQFPEGSIQAQQQAAIAGSQTGDGRRPEPIRNRGKRVGRNEQCPCGSGKKYKNCCMRKMVG